MINQLDIFVRNLKNIINDRDIKLNNLAQKTGVSAPTVTNTLSGAQTPSLKFILKISEVFNISVAELFTPDIRQFPVKQDVEEANLMEIVEMQKEQISGLEEELEKAMEENERLDKELLRLQFSEDVGKEIVVDEPKLNDSHVKLFIEYGFAKAFVDNVELNVLSHNLGTTSSTIEITVDEVHIEY